MALVDTSVLIASERGHLPEIDREVEYAISAITLAELYLGLHGAKTVRNRALRFETLLGIESTFQTIDVDPFVARQYAALIAHHSTQGMRPASFDTLIAATAITHGLPLYTRDKGFAVFEELDLRLV